MINDKTVMNSPPIKVTAHNGMLSKKPQSSTAVTISAGSTVSCAAPKPAAFMMVEISPCTMLNRAIISSKPYVTAALARAKRINTLRACSGRFSSAKEPQVFITPTTKNKTSSASPMACTAPWMPTITFQIVPPLNCSGDCVMSCQISASFSFHVSSAFSKFCTIQLSDIRLTSRQRNITGDLIAPSIPAVGFLTGK